jgi:4-alpha-glucanotransferase
MQALYDVVRIDHFRGFESYYAIPARDKTAVNGVWRKGPGTAFIDVIRRKLPDVRIIAEDLGYLTDDVKALLRASGFPGMKVLQFAFDSREESDYLPHNYTQNSVVYTGTPDNTTTADWELSAPAGDVAFARRYLECGGDRDFTPAFYPRSAGKRFGHRRYFHAGLAGPGDEARINTPSHALGGNGCGAWAPPPDGRLGGRYSGFDEAVRPLLIRTFPFSFFLKRKRVPHGEQPAGARFALCFFFFRMPVLLFPVIKR